MPKRKYTRKRRKRRRRLKSRGIRKRFRRKYRSRIPNSIQNRSVRKFRWVLADHALTSPSGVMISLQFNANSPHSPCPSVTGSGQPVGWDQWVVFFEKYMVLGSKMDAYITGNQNQRGTVGLYSTTDLVAFGNERSYIENKRGPYRFLSHNTRAIKMKSSYSPKRMFAIKDIKDNKSNLGASFGSSPNMLSYFRMWFRSVDTATETIRITFVIDFIVLLHERVNMDPS